MATSPRSPRKAVRRPRLRGGAIAVVLTGTLLISGSGLPKPPDASRLLSALKVMGEEASKEMPAGSPQRRSEVQQRTVDVAAIYAERGNEEMLNHIAGEWNHGMSRDEAYVHFRVCRKFCNPFFNKLRAMLSFSVPFMPLCTKVHCGHRAHPVDIVPCIHAAHRADRTPFGLGPCQHPAHPAGDRAPCQHAAHPFGDLIC